MLNFVLGCTYICIQNTKKKNTRKKAMEYKLHVKERTKFEKDVKCDPQEIPYFKLYCSYTIY